MATEGCDNVPTVVRCGHHLIYPTASAATAVMHSPRSKPSSLCSSISLRNDDNNIIKVAQLRRSRPVRWSGW